MFGFLKNLFNSEKLYTDVTTDTFKTMMTNKNTIVVDVRTPNEYKSGKIGKAKNINVASFDFMNRIKEVDKSKDLLIYCRSGARSARACKMITKLGFEKVHNLQGGIMAWQNHGNKIG